MTSEETISKVLSLMEQKYRRNIRKLTLFVIIYSIVCLGIIACSFFYNWIDDVPIIILVILVTLPILVALRSEFEKNEKGKYEGDKFILTNKSKNHYSFFLRGETFENYVFYEAALDDFNSALQALEKESEQIAESLPKFFEEYNIMTKFVDGIHRPVPNFRNHSRIEFYQCYLARKKCLEKLERYDEAKADEEKLKTIAILNAENNNLTEKYWKDYVNQGYGNYDD